MTEREKFEKEVLKRAGDGYATTWADMMWEGWQAATASTQEQGAAINGFEVNDRPYKHDQRKRAWVLGFRAGLEIVRSKKMV